MRFAIVSDTHDNVKNFLKAIHWLNAEGIEVMLHCGDICTQDTIDQAHSHFKGALHLVRGNGDYDLHEVADTKEIELGRKRIFFNHYPDTARKMADGDKYDLVFYGHTHRPWEETIGKCRLVNPGELAGQRYKACFAVYDTESDVLQLKILEQITPF